MPYVGNLLSITTPRFYYGFGLKKAPLGGGDLLLD